MLQWFQLISNDITLLIVTYSDLSRDLNSWTVISHFYFFLSSYIWMDDIFFLLM